MELELTGYLVVGGYPDGDMAVRYFENAQDVDAWLDAGNEAYKITPVTRLLPATLKCVSRAPGYPVAYVSNTD